MFERDGGIDGGFGCDGWVWFGAVIELKSKGRENWGVAPQLCLDGTCDGRLFEYGWEVG